MTLTMYVNHFVLTEQKEEKKYSRDTRLFKAREQQNWKPSRFIYYLYIYIFFFCWKGGFLNTWCIFFHHYFSPSLLFSFKENYESAWFWFCFEYFRIRCTNRSLKFHRKVVYYFYFPPEDLFNKFLSPHFSLPISSFLFFIERSSRSISVRTRVNLFYAIAIVSFFQSFSFFFFINSHRSV